jgi:hypothetical protein
MHLLAPSLALALVPWVNRTGTRLELALVQILAGALLVDLLISIAFQVRVRSRHPGAWQELGRPGILPVIPPNRELRRSRAEFYGGGFRSLGDEALDRLHLARRILTVIYVAAFLGLLLLRIW